MIEPDFAEEARRQQAILGTPVESGGITHDEDFEFLEEPAPDAESAKP